jgi:glycosyltransferase involved in cell wall biosynthesis
MAETRRRDTQKREQPVETVAIPQEPVEAPVEPRVAAILVSHNQAAALRRAIEALEKSHHRDRLEIIVVDCASDDESRELDSEYENITLLRLPHNMGATRAMNIGTRTSKAEILFFLSPDVEVAPDTVTNLADRLENQNDTGAVAPLLADSGGHATSRGQSIEDALAGNPGQAIAADAECVEVGYAGREALMIRKQFLKGMNYFDERFGHFGADLDLAMQMQNAQRKIAIYPSIRVTVHPAPDPNADDPLFSADRILGTAAFLGKHQGFLRGLTYRIGATLKALGGMRFKELAAVASGQKLDGSQSM